MELTVLDRLLMLSILPKEGDLTTLRIIRKLKEDLSFSEEEHKVLKFVSDEHGLHWDKEGNSLKEVSIGPKAASVVAESIKRVSEQEKLTEDFLHICDLFIEEKEE